MSWEKTKPRIPLSWPLSEPIPLRVAKLLQWVTVIGAGLAASLWAGDTDRPGRNGTPDWDLPLGFEPDVFVFRRVQYYSVRSFRGIPKWEIDYPDAEINLSYRLQQLTSVRTHPDGDLVTLSDPKLFDTPFIYIVEPGDMLLTDDEVTHLRIYLLNGGFLLVDDFWGDREWYNFHEQIVRVFPDRPIIDLPPEHPIFHCVFDLNERLQVPNVGTGHYSQWTGITWEEYKMPGARDPHYRAILDDRGRMMVMICHNTDNGDGWEQEGASQYFFKAFSEKQAYPLGINILFYAMSH